MTSGSGSSHEPCARRRGWPYTLSLFFTAALAACAPPTGPGPTTSTPTPHPLASQTRPTHTVPAPTSTAIPEHRVGLGAPDHRDTFDSDTGWETGASARGAVSRLGDRLVVSVQGPSSTLASLSPTDPLADFFVEIEIHSEICEAGDEFGLMVRTGGSGIPGQDSHYRFLITCDGAIRASRFLSGAEAPILPITPSADVFPGAPAVNRIGVLAIGDEFRFFVNDMQVFQLQDGEIPTGRIGVIVRARHGAQTTVSFDEFMVWDLATR